jgi:YggT family protein
MPWSPPTRRRKHWEGSAIHVIITFASLLVWILTIAIFVRALLSWIPNLDPRNPFVMFIIQITEPVLAPVRAVVPRIGMIDLSPMIAIIVLQIILQALQSL